MKYSKSIKSKQHDIQHDTRNYRGGRRCGYLL